MVRILNRVMGAHQERALGKENNTQDIVNDKLHRCTKS